MNNEEGDKVIIRVDADLEELMPTYLENRRKDIESILAALATADYPAIETLGHRMKGSGGGYGLDGISEIGREIELSAKDKNGDRIRKAVVALANYLDRIKIVYG